MTLRSMLHIAIPFILLSACGCGSNAPQTETAQQPVVSENPANAPAATSPFAANPIPTPPHQTELNNESDEESTSIDPVPEPSTKITVAAASSELPPVESTTDWHRFRGPNGTGVSAITGLPTEWSDDKNIRWKTALPGPGVSSPVVWNNNVYVTCFTGYDWPKNHAGKKRVGDLERHLICVDLQTGDIKWKRSHKAEHYKRDMDLANSNHWQLVSHGFASNTPACDARGVYAFFGAEGLFAFTHDGEPRWNTSCGEGHNRTGSASSPFVHGELVFISASTESSTFYAINTADGQIVWKVGRTDSYATPVIQRHNQQTNLLIRCGEGNPLLALNPLTGEERWRSTEASGRSDPSLLAVDGKIFSLDNQLGIKACDANGNVLWKQRGQPYHGTPVYQQGRLYFEREGLFSCIDVETGEFLQRMRLPAGSTFASPVTADRNIYCVTREKGTCVIGTQPEMKLLAHNSFAGDDSCFGATPAVTSQGLILRSYRYLYCIAETKQ